MTILLSTAYLPPISYISGCLHAEQLLIERFETYPKQTHRNHCYIYGPNGKQTLSIPVIKVNGNHTLTKDIRIAMSTPWQRLHWRSIETAYNNSPFFLYYKDEFEKVFEKQFDFLLDLNTHLLETIFKIFSIDNKIGFTDHFLKIPDGVEDHRESRKKKKTTSNDAFPPYTQVFSPQHGFIADLSIIDLLFNLGPESSDFLVKEK
jgi:WbqC-like protein family